MPIFQDLVFFVPTTVTTTTMTTESITLPFVHAHGVKNIGGAVNVQKQ